ncbi:MAG TPA: TonB-dependent receptor, partial [Bacteroidia bacterium]|nr:TonB-dependent receptor [Bacteroidia bacterium]
MKIIIASCFFLSTLLLNAQNITQTIRGRAVDAISKMEVPGVQIAIYKDSLKINSAQTDTNGFYRATNIPVGRVTVYANSLGYKPLFFKIDMLSGKEFILNLEMEELAIKINEVIITATRKGEVRNEMASVSAKTFTVEETNRYAGSRSDPARMASNFAGVQGSDDSRNDIIIRGNSPMGLLWRLDGVDIPNPNHFAVAGSMGGPVSIINNKTLDNSEFYTGAFPAEYGNCNAGVFDLRMRNGNNEKHELTGQFGFLGTELIAEGPLSKKTGASYLASYRYSTLKLFDALNIKIGTDAVPSYQDGAFKLNFPCKKGGNLSLFGIGGKSNIAILVSKYTKPSQDLYGDNDRDQYFATSMLVGGATYTKSINEKTFLKIVAAHSISYSKTNHVLVERDSNYIITAMINQMGYRYNEQKSSFNISINKKISSKLSYKMGLLFSYYNFNLVDSILNITTNKFIYRNDYKSGTSLSQGYLQYRFKPTEKFVFTAGLYGQYFFINQSSSFEPRLGLKYYLRENHIFSAGFGLHSQMQPTYIYFTGKTDPSGNYILHNKNIGLTRSIHHIISYDWFTAKNIHVKIEAYYQYLYKAPIDLYPSAFSLLNQGSGYDRFFPDKLINKGTGSNIGAEFTLEKSFDKNFFFLFTGSVYDSKYKGSDGVERNTDFNGHFALNALLVKEYKLGANKNSILTLGTKITYAGGKRYTPADTLASVAANEIVVIDSLRNTKQFKNYFRWDIKVGFRANRKKLTHEIG